MSCTLCNSPAIRSITFVRERVCQSCFDVYRNRQLPIFVGPRDSRRRCRRSLLRFDGGDEWQIARFRKDGYKNPALVRHGVTGTCSPTASAHTSNFDLEEEQFRSTGSPDHHSSPRILDFEPSVTMSGPSNSASAVRRPCAVQEGNSLTIYNKVIEKYKHGKERLLETKEELMKQLAAVEKKLSQCDTIMDEAKQVLHRAEQRLSALGESAARTLCSDSEAENVDEAH